MMLVRVRMLALIILLSSGIYPASACGVPGLDQLIAEDATVLVERTCGLAMEKGAPGEAFKFQDPGVSVMGSVTAGDAFKDKAGIYCRRLTVDLVRPAGGRLERRRWPGVACRAGHLDWRWSDVEIREVGDAPAKAGMRGLQRRF